MKNNKHLFYSAEEIKFLKLPLAMSLSFLSVFPCLSEETIATAESDAIYRGKC
jgi:hypothetical protein